MGRDALTFLSYLSDVRSIELKMAVPAANRAGFVRLGLDALEGKIREVVFFDTPDLALYGQGLVVRARRTQRGQDDTVVKLRPLPERLSADLRASPDMKVEMDVNRDAYVVSASLRGIARVPVRAVVEGSHTVARAFTKLQRRFFEDHRPAGTSWDDLVPLGPMYVVVLRCHPRDLPHRVTIEQWHFPGQVPLVEVSIKATPTDVVEARRDLVGWLQAHDLWAEDDQEPKTRAALEFCARQLPTRAAGQARPIQTDAL
jgi:hypothetical protein